MDEIWKDVQGYEGYYQVSSIGRCRGIDRIIRRNDGRSVMRKGKVMGLRKNRDGYITVMLTKNGVHKTVTIHRLVAKAFIPNPDSLYTVNHKDLNKSNNVVTNLEWCSHQDNMRHLLKYGHPVRLSGEKSSQCKLTDTDVLEIRRLLKNPDLTQMKIAAKYGVNQSLISFIKLGVTRPKLALIEGK